MLLGMALLAACGTLLAQPPAPLTTSVLVNLTVKPDSDRAQLPKLMPQEVRDTVRLYLDGKIQQWYGRADGRGVLFVMNCNTVAEAKALMEALPLAKANLVNLEYTPLSPLTPLRYLLAEPSGTPKSNP